MHTHLLMQLASGLDAVLVKELVRAEDLAELALRLLRASYSHFRYLFNLWYAQLLSVQFQDFETNLKFTQKHGIYN